MPSTIRVLIVDDSALIRQMLTRALSVDPRIEIVGIAKTGVEAIEKARALSPDVITLDIEMPELSGIEALPHLSKHSSARIVMLSSIDDPDTTYHALCGGAVDFIAKPHSGFATSITDLSELLLKKIKTAYRIDPSRTSPVLERFVVEATDPLGTGVAATDLKAVVGIGASTGGPPALERVFSGLSLETPAAYLVVQHLPAGFTASLARRLSNASEIDVVEATDGVQIKAGHAYLAPYGTHMTADMITVTGEAFIRLSDEPSVHGVRPAVDPLFSSIARFFGPRGVAILLTGMGSDGARGMAEIQQAGGDTIAQNEETSVVWGMPGAASKVGAVRHLAPIGLIAAEIRRTLRTMEVL
ncbi:MAG: chemotaxis-specific protein-glutamate methyltransferase CheB [Actinomycetota bacterium]|jgi:two-component system chemotaxis response regulator CheB|nr:chemotaxis-specific protein-glutamate methyltransferase CheB [Actinomycetota bacterium]